MNTNSNKHDKTNTNTALRICQVVVGRNIQKHTNTALRICQSVVGCNIYDYYYRLLSAATTTITATNNLLE